MSKNTLKEFRRLFWAARRAHTRAGPTATEDSPEHQEGLAYARAQGLKWAEALLQASLLESKRRAEDALEALHKAEAHMPKSARSLFWFVEGAALHEQGHFDDAVKVFHRALDDPDFERRGDAWHNLGLALYDNGQPEEAIEAWERAVKESDSEAPGDTWYNLGLALMKKGEIDDAIKCYRKALAESQHLCTRGDIWDAQGIALTRKHEYDEGIRAYHKALEDPNHKTPGRTWYNLGIVLGKKGEHDEAIKAYRKALEDPNYEKKSRVWNNLGNAFCEKSLYDEAIKAHRKALDDPNYDGKSRAWNNLGNALWKKGRLHEAIKAYHTALEDANAWAESQAPCNLAAAYRRAGRTKEALEVLSQVLKTEHVHPTIASRAKALLSVIEGELNEKSLSPNDQAMLASTGAVKEGLQPEERIIAKIQSAEQTQYEKYLQGKGSDTDNFITVLRGWSSAVTLLEGSERVWRGGGYFLKWQGQGIVIDPGFDFLRNFHDAGYHGREIDAVLVSHNHSDHNADLRSVDDLRYELYKRRHRDPNGGVSPYLLIWDADSQAALKFSIEEPEHQFPPIHFDIGRCNPCDEIKLPERFPFSVEYFPVKHGNDIRNAVGFKIRLGVGEDVSLTVGYTGDTEFFPELSEYLAGSDLLIAHISQPDTGELLDAGKRKKNHLGYRGLVELVTRCNPKYTVVGEFWAGLSDLRIDLVQGIRRLTGQTRILPAGIGLHITLPDMEVECTQCGTKIAFDNVRVSPPAGRFGNLAYLCPDCVLS